MRTKTCLPNNRERLAGFMEVREDVARSIVFIRAEFLNQVRGEPQQFNLNIF